MNADAGIEKPSDLIGKRIGTPEYQMTAPVWIRGLLEEHYGVPIDGVTYVTGGEESPNRDEKLKLDLPPNIRLERIGGGAQHGIVAAAVNIAPGQCFVVEPGFAAVPGHAAFLGHADHVGMGQARAQQLVDHVAHAARVVEMVHVARSVGIDAGQQGDGTGKL